MIKTERNLKHKTIYNLVNISFTILLLHTLLKRGYLKKNPRSSFKLYQIRWPTLYFYALRIRLAPCEACLV